jgi:hypothetical protein
MKQSLDQIATTIHIDKCINLNAKYITKILLQSI